jgi:hypothetical protein
LKAGALTTTISSTLCVETQDFLSVSHGFSPTRVTVDFKRDFWDIEAACSSHCIIATITSIGMLHRDGLILKTAIQKFGFESPR